MSWKNIFNKNKFKMKGSVRTIWGTIREYKEILLIIIAGSITGYSIALTSQKSTLNALAENSIAIASSIFALFPYVVVSLLYSNLNYVSGYLARWRKLLEISFLISVFSIVELMYLWLSEYLFDLEDTIIPAKLYAGGGFSFFWISLLMFLYALTLLRELIKDNVNQGQLL